MLEIEKMVISLVVPINKKFGKTALLTIDMIMMDFLKSFP